MIKTNNFALSTMEGIITIGNSNYIQHSKNFPNDSEKRASVSAFYYTFNLRKTVT